MNVNKFSLEKLNEHWAISAINSKERDKAFELAEQNLVNNAIGEQFHFNFGYSSSDEILIQKVSLAYELAAIEGLQSFLAKNTNESTEILMEQCVVGAYKSFELQRILDIPQEWKKKVYHVLHVSALGYCGERGVDVNRWLKENSNNIKLNRKFEKDWAERVLCTLYSCWISLFRKENWEDIDRIIEFVKSLREDQKIYENEYFEGEDGLKNGEKALHLVSLYHWAKATELQANYMLKGMPTPIESQLDTHYDAAIEAATACQDKQMIVLLRWLWATSRQMAESSVWKIKRKVDFRSSEFVENLVKVSSLFELLPPQQTAVNERGLLDPAATAVVVDMPTSGGKTLLAQFKILQALNQFSQNTQGWVAYIAPTKALVSQITRRLRRDFEPLGLKVEKLTGAVDIDSFEEDLLKKVGDEKSFDVLVATPEKLQLVIRNKKVSRPLVLAVMDEAHNIEDESRGLRIELLLATIKSECSSANFLLLMPFVQNPEKIAEWLSNERKTGKTISLSTSPWRPNQRIVGLFDARETKNKEEWQLEFETAITTNKTVHLKGKHLVGGPNPLFCRFSELNQTKNTAAMAKILSERGTSIAVGRRISDVWNMAKELEKVMPPLKTISDNIRLVQNFISTEIGSNFELIKMLNKGIGVHNSGLSDELRSLMEWLAEKGELKVLCATTTIAQGINFPVSSVFLASPSFPGRSMTPREFWNLAGRAGRMNHESLGVVGLAQNKKNRLKILTFLNQSTGDLVSRLVHMVDDFDKIESLTSLKLKKNDGEWEDFRCYIAHLCSEYDNLDKMLSDTEQILRNTLGYSELEVLNDGKTKKLLDLTKKYIESLNNYKGQVKLSNMTGFSPEGIYEAIKGMRKLENKLTLHDWKPESLFGTDSTVTSDLYSVMLKVPQLERGLKDTKNKTPDNKKLSEITKAWVAGKSVEEIAEEFFKNDKGDRTEFITNACRTIYGTLVNNGTWGLSALTKIGIDFDDLSEEDKREINLLPAMIYHGVNTEEAVLLRMNSMPRKISNSFGKILKEKLPKIEYSIGAAREFIKNSSDSDWNRAAVGDKYLSGKEYKQIWKILSGE